MTKFSVFGSTFVSSLAAVENQSVLLEKLMPKLSPLDPFRLFFFNRRTNSRKCTEDIKVVHAHLIKSNIFRSDILVANSLVQCYCESGRMVYALRVFEQIPHPDVLSWNFIISGYNMTFLYEDSWATFCRMHSFGFEPSEFTYGTILSACSAWQSPLCGKQVYTLATKHGFASSGYVRAGTINLFAKSGSLEDALRVFYDASFANVVCWNSIISGCVRNNGNFVALDLFCQMCRGFVVPNSFTFSSILTACAALQELELGKGVHGWVIKCAAGDDVFVGTAIIDVYAKCGEMEEAVKEFLRMPVHNVVSWSAIICGFVQMGDAISAFQYFKEMRKMGQEVNKYTVTSMLTASADPTLFKEAIQIHCWIFTTGFYCEPSVKASLMNMYSKIGKLDFCELVFRETEDLKHIGPWAVMISAFAQNKSSGRAIDMFHRMFQEGLRPDKFCSSSVLSAVGSLNSGRQIHCYTLKAGLLCNVSVGSSLFTMYSKCGSLVESYEVFKQLEEKDNVSWASMIAGFAEHGFADQAIQLFREMLFKEIMPDKVTLTGVLTASAAIRSLITGKEVHGYALRRGVSKYALVSGALVNMYSKCGTLDIARRVFEVMPVKDQVSWSSLVSGYAQNECIEEALLLFREMQMDGLEVDSFTLSSVFGAVSLLNRLGIGMQMHAHTLKLGLESEVSVGSSLVMMYSKCGSIDDCQKAFKQIKKPDLISWTAMISSNAQHGKGTEALGVYELMRESGIVPDSVTFVGILSACSRSGLVEEGFFHFHSMVKDYAIEPGQRHYACMVDLLGRSGRLKQAANFINNMPIKPDALVWGTLLAACKMHGDIELGRLAAKRVTELEPCDAGAYISLSNICADVGQWEEVLNIRHEMKGTGVQKDPGLSSV